MGLLRARFRIGRTARAWVAVALATATQLSAQTPPTREYQIKAAFLYNFARFVEWPPAAFPSADSPLRIGILGEDPFGDVLESIVRDETIRHRRLVIERASRAEDLRDCQLVFVSKSENGRTAEILSQLGASRTLTVSDIGDFARRGGVIDFYLESNKVRFEINPDAARREGLRISSQLLSLGKLVASGEGT